MTGRVVGNYRLIDKLGEGGMGKVYRAVDSMIEREVAIKALKPEIAAQPGTLERFRTEAITLARLNHPAVAQLYSFFKDGDEYFMAMEFVPGESLETIIQRDGALPWPVALNYAIRMLEGIQHAHSLGVLHRDLKPANVMLTSGGTIKLMDFGIAQVLGAAKMTREGRMVGTLEYLAPERIQGKSADVRSDIYSLGVLLYEMLSGRLPFQADSEYELLMAHVQQRPPSPRALGLNLPPPVESALMLALEKDPTQRYQDASSFAEALRTLLPAGKATVLSEPVHSGSRTSPVYQRKIWMGAALGLSVVAMFAVALVIFRQIRPEPQPPQPQPVAQYEPPPEPASRPSTFQPPEGSGVSPLPSQPPPDAPVHTPPPVSAPPKPVAPAVPQQKPSAPVSLSPAARRASIAALERTDGPVAGLPGTQPLQLVGLVSALKIGAPSILPEVAEIVVRRGVSFRASAQYTQELREAGATPEFLRVVEASYRAPEISAAPAKPVAPAPEPVAAPPPAAPTKTIHSLRDVKTVFVEPMPSQLDEFIRDEIARQLSGRVEVARSRSAADALLTVVLEEQKGGAASGAGRLLGLKDKTRITTKVLDRATRSVVWIKETGDRKVIVGAFQADTSKRLAERVVKEIKDAIN